MSKSFRIPLRELREHNIKVKIAKPNQQVKDLLSTHVLDTRKIDPSKLFYASVDEAKRAQLKSWEKLAKTFAKRTRKL